MSAKSGSHLVKEFAGLNPKLQPVLELRTSMAWSNLENVKIAYRQTTGVDLLWRIALPNNVAQYKGAMADFALNPTAEISKLATYFAWKKSEEVMIYWALAQSCLRKIVEGEDRETIFNTMIPKFKISGAWEKLDEDCRKCVNHGRM